MLHLGLDTSHEAFHGAYSAFNRFRQAVARAIGGSYPPHEQTDLDGNRWYWADKDGPSKYPGLEVFFNHSDCDGVLTPEEASRIADEMEALLPALDSMGGGGGHIERDGGCGEVARRFIAGCRAAHAANEPVVFH